MGWGDSGVKMHPILSLLAGFWVISPGCTGVGAETSLSHADRQTQTAQVILKFRDPKFDPSAGDYLSKLSAQMGVNIIYVRPMSGDAHVLRIEAIGTGDSFRRAMDRISTRPEVDWVEQDRIMRHQSH